MVDYFQFNMIPNLDKHTSTIDEVISEFLYISDISGAENYREKGITHIVSLLGSRAEFDYLNVDLSRENHLKIFLDDSENQNIIEAIVKSLYFMEKAKGEKNSRILVHCSAGISRSATICMAYLMKTYNLSVEQACRWLRSKRSCVCPNQGFIRQLKNIDFIQ